MLVINGKKVDFEKGKTILEVAEENGIYIPTLCSHPELPGFGACRLCLVNIKNEEVVTACTTPAQDGMIITTDDPEVQGLRREVLELILSEHPSSCLVCTQKEECERYRAEPIKAGKAIGCQMCSNKEKCELRKVVEYVGLNGISHRFEYRNLPLEREDPFLDRDYNLCILCGRCVRMCQEVHGIGAIDFIKRGHKTRVGTAFGKTHLEGNCSFCGVCIDVCPTGAISARGSKWYGKPEKVVSSTCALCNMGCSLNLELKWGKVVAAVPIGDYSKGCTLGRFCIPPLVNSLDRLSFPAVRRNGLLVPVGWEEALSFIARKLQSYSPDEIGFLASPFLTNESAYVFQKFVRTVVGTNNIDVTSGFSEIAKKINPDVSLTGIEECDWLMVVGGDPFIPPLIKLYINRARRKGCKTILVGRGFNGQMKTADIFVDVATPSKYIRLFSAMLRLMIDKGRYGQDLQRLEEMKESLVDSPPSNDKIEEIVNLLVSSKKGYVLCTPGVSSYYSQIIPLVLNILVLTGNDNNLLTWERGNSFGVCSMGAAPCYLPYFRGLDETSEFEKIWEKKLPKKPGLNYREMLEHACKVLYLTEPIPSSIPKKVELLILQGVYPASLMDRADVVLPAAAFTEEDGSFISIEGETRVVKKAAEAGVYPDWKIFSLLAREMGGKGFDYRNVNEIRDEILSLPGEESKEKAGLIPVETTAVEKIGDKGPRVCYRGVDLSEEINDLKAVLESFQRGNKGDE